MFDPSSHCGEKDIKLLINLPNKGKKDGSHLTMVGEGTWLQVDWG